MLMFCMNFNNFVFVQMGKGFCSFICFISTIMCYFKSYFFVQPLTKDDFYKLYISP